MESSHSSERIPVSTSSNAHTNTNTNNYYKEKISTLPRDNSWKAVNHLYRYQGFWHFPVFLEGVMAAQEHFKAHPTDIMVCSPPQSGTTWLKSLTFAILTRTRFNDSTTPLLTTLPHECIPFLEIDHLVQNPNNRSPEFPLLATHIPYTSLPKSIISLGCKIVYICRDPKDMFVSQWHFRRRLTPKGQEPIPLEEAFELFCRGLTPSGPYWDHVLGYWKASLERPERVLFIKYEDMKRDTVFYVKKLAEFMGYSFSLEEEREGAVQNIIKLCSFENLSNLEVNKMGMHRPDTLPIENNIFFRKGQVGDWQNHLTPEMAERADEIIKHKLGIFGLTFHVSS